MKNAFLHVESLCSNVCASNFELVPTLSSGCHKQKWDCIHSDETRCLHAVFAQQNILLFYKKYVEFTIRRISIIGKLVFFLQFFALLVNKIIFYFYLCIRVACSPSTMPNTNKLVSDKKIAITRKVDIDPEMNNLEWFDDLFDHYTLITSHYILVSAYAAFIINLNDSKNILEVLIICSHNAPSTDIYNKITITTSKVDCLAITCWNMLKWPIRHSAKEATENVLLSIRC